MADCQLNWFGYPEQSRGQLETILTSFRSLEFLSMGATGLGGIMRTDS
jgi:hypothetical protein